MGRVKAQDTGPEVALRKALFAAGVRGWRCNRSTLPGKPDLAFGRARVVVFVDGAFWHGHPSKYWEGRSGSYWDKKIKRNQERDKKITAELSEAGWKVVRLWDFEIERDLENAVRKVKTAITA